MDYADLHLHSTHSDGKMSVNEIIEHANNINLKSISITDHDTLEGTIEALQSRNKSNLDIISGIEFSSVYKDEEIHILGYLFDPTHKGLLSFTHEMQSRRTQRAVRMIEKFNSNGIDITMSELLELSKGESIGRPHFAHILIKKGYANTLYDAFEKYLIPGSACYVERYKLSPEDTIKMIKEAGGISILAHPGLMKDQSLMKDIHAMSIDGIEVYHSNHDSKQTRDYYYYAKNNNLLITGGSDCHSNIPNEKPFIGSIKIPYSYVESLQQAKELK